jgi:hypothetical protein
MLQRKPAFLLVLAVAVTCWFAGVAPLYAGNIRGRIVRQGPSGDYPVGGIAVRVRQGTNGGLSGIVYSGQDGMYYLYKIPPGQYTLHVYGRPNSQPLTFAIQVSNQPWTDLAPIRLR